MTRLNRTNLFGEMMPLYEAVNSLFEQSFLNPSGSMIGGRSISGGLELNVYEDDDNYFILGVLPGVDPNKLEVTAFENTLTLRGEIQSLAPEGKRVLWQELPSGTFERHLTLPAPFNVDKAEARFEDGLIKLVVPKAEQARVRKIQVRTPQAQLTGGTGSQK